MFQVDPRIDYSVRASLAIAALLWGGIPPLVQLLVILMTLDIVTGFLAAASTRSLSSEVSLKGVTKKALILCLVAAAAALQSFIQGSGVGISLPLDQVVAGFYAGHEGLSILENATGAGLPVPQALVKALSRVEEVGGGVSPAPDPAAPVKEAS